MVVRRVFCDEMAKDDVKVLEGSTTRSYAIAA